MLNAVRDRVIVSLTLCSFVDVFEDDGISNNLSVLAINTLIQQERSDSKDFYIYITLSEHCVTHFWGLKPAVLHCSRNCIQLL